MEMLDMCKKIIALEEEKERLDTQIVEYVLKHAKKVEENQTATRGFSFFIGNLMEMQRKLNIVDAQLQVVAEMIENANAKNISDMAEVGDFF